MDHDFCLAWNWPYDADFVDLVEAAGRSQGVSVLQVTPETLPATLEGLAGGSLSFRLLLDRASDTDERFLALERWAFRQGALVLNRHERASQAWDKAAMHRLLGVALHTLPTIILPPYVEQPELPHLDLAPLGPRFSIKPASGGGGEGVIIGATSPEQVRAARQERPEERLLLQSHLEPVLLEGRPAWFRTLYCTGEVFACWWHPCSHFYTPVSPEEEEQHRLALLRPITFAIAHLCGLDLFSSEIALAPDGRFIVVDYVNDPLDLRLQSRTPEGVPDAIVEAIAGRLVALACQTRFRTLA